MFNIAIRLMCLAVFVAFFTSIFFIFAGEVLKAVYYILLCIALILFTTRDNG